MPTHGTLSRRHREYDAALMSELEDLYEGGYQILSKAEQYLPRLTNEHESVHGDRCKSASYLPYLGQIVDQLTAWLFGDAPSVLPAPDAADPDTPGELPDQTFYGAFASDADRAGMGFGDVLRCLVPCALIQRHAILGIDFPVLSDDEEQRIASAADEDREGARRAYCFVVPVEELINWDTHPDGTFKWTVLWQKTCPQDGPLEPTGKVVEEFKVWTLEPGGARWQRYRIEYPEGKSPKPEDEVPLVAEGVAPFDCIPVLRLTLPKGLWVGNKIGPLAREHFQRRSTLISAEYKSLVEIAVLKLGPEVSAIGDAMPSEIQQDPSRAHRNPVEAFRRRGLFPIGKDDELKFVGPSGVAYALVDGELEKLKDEIFRVVHLMAASVSNNKSAALGRSGLAKQQDKADTAIVLSAIGAYVRRFAVKAYGVISRARGEDVVWQAKGLDDYGVEDRELLLEEALQIDNIPMARHSKTWRTSYETRIALKLEGNLPPETQAVVRQELTKGIEDDAKQQELMDEAAREAAKKPTPGPTPTTPQAPKPPNGTAPTPQTPKPPQPSVRA